MGSAAKKPGGLYGALLRAYPQGFREHYGPTMAQTLDDMLGHEPSRGGRLAIWARTLADLPVSAAKEHISNGKELRMNRNMKIIFVSVVAALILANAASFWAGNLHARSAAAVKRVTPAQLADAMASDSFYSSYGDTALLFSGRVAGVRVSDGKQLVTFYTGRPYAVTCQMSGTGKVSAGQEISIAVTGGSAERQAHGVLLHDCLRS